MSKFRLSDVPRRSLVWSALGLIVFALLAWKLSVDYVAARHAESGGKPPVEIAGFRSAAFGSDETAVRAAIARDFNIGDDGIREGVSPIEKTGLLAIRVKDVVPDTGDAEIVYILGYKSKTLIQVNIVWGSQMTPGIAPAQIAAAANALGQYFATQGFVPASVKTNEKLASGAILVFSGNDLQGRLVSLLYQEATKKADAPEAKPAPDKKAKKSAADKPAAAPEAAEEKLVALRLSYIKDKEEPDIFKIEQGQF